MKIKAENFLKKIELDNSNIFLVSGLDETLIDYVKAKIINAFKGKNFFIDKSGKLNHNSLGDLFSSKKTLFILATDSFAKLDIDSVGLSNNKVLIVSPNSKKTNLLKPSITKRENATLIECYPLNKDAKELVTQNFFKNNGMRVSNEVFWYVVENFNNEYVFLLEELKILSLFKNKINTIQEVESVVASDRKINITKIFFHIFKKNSSLVNIFNQNISSVSDLYVFLNSVKLNIGFIAGSKNKNDALLKFPKYLFKEKDVFKKIYDFLDQKKIVSLYKSAVRFELLIRQFPSMHKAIGVRFFLNLKKIITS